jgi:hypothetical protein
LKTSARSSEESPADAALVPNTKWVPVISAGNSEPRPLLPPDWLSFLSSNHAKVFCPKCGHEMTLADSHAGTTYKCVPGDIQLSRVMHDRLSEVFVTQNRHAEGREGVGSWFCPRCGKLMNNEDGHVRCVECGEFLDEFIHGLVELHPHLTRLLLTVEDSFDIRGRGLVLAPFLLIEEARPRPFPVALHRPDGTIRWASALAQVPFVDPPPKEPRVHLLLLDTPKGEVPIGTRVWIG